MHSLLPMQAYLYLPLNLADVTGTESSDASTES